MARRKRQEEPENHDRWLVSYADFVTLLFAFFVVMYAISSVNDGKYRVLSTTLVDAFQHDRRSPDPIQVGEVARSLAPVPDDAFRGLPEGAALNEGADLHEEMAEPVATDEVEAADKISEEEEFPLEPIASDIKASLAPFIEQELIEVNQTRYWVEVGIKSKMLFPSGSARLSRDALKAMGDIADILKPLPNPIHVEGHTDNVPIRTVSFPSNWELSAARAASVVHLFTRLGIDPQRLAAIGYGEHKPLVNNSTLEGRQKNRRVSLVIMARSKQQDRRAFPTPPTGGGQ